MLRFAAPEDVSAMLAIYAPYVLHTTATFEYAPPEEGEFLRRFRTVPKLGKRHPKAQHHRGHHHPHRQRDQNIPEYTFHIQSLPAPW